MAIPANIHPACLVAASFGLDFPKRLEDLDREKVLGGVAKFLGVPMEQMEQALAWFSVQGAEHLERFLEDPDWIHNVPEVLERWLPVLFGALDGLLEGEGAVNLRSRIQQFVEQNTGALDDLRVLLSVASVRQGECLNRDKFLISLHRALRMFCTELAQKNDEQYRFQARKLMARFLELSPFAGNANGPSRIHSLAHINEAQRLAQEGRFRASTYQAISALKSAFEGPIHDVVTFVWRLAHPSKTGDDNLPRDRKGFPIKGNIFKDARDWCNKNHVSFPFDPALDQLRNSEAHDSFRVEKDGSVSFFSHGTLVASIAHGDLLTRVNREIHFAHLFIQSLWIGEVAIRNQRGDFDDAWRRAKSRVPDLEARVLLDDDDAADGQ